MKTSPTALNFVSPALALAAAGLIGMSGVCFAQSLPPTQSETKTTETKVKETQVKEVKPSVKEEVATTRETKIDGLLHLTGPESVTVKVRDSDPATYRYGKMVQFVDEEGNVVSRDVIPPGTPVTVHTSIAPTGGIVTDRVTVHMKTATSAAPGGKSATTTTTLTETTEKRTKVDGVLMEKEADRVLVRAEKEGNLTFSYSPKTEFMDSEGKHVDLIKMVPGMPVQVEFLQVGDRLEARRVLVRGRVKD